GTYCRTRGSRTAPESGTACRLCHFHYTQDIERADGRHHPRKREVWQKTEQHDLPGYSGRSADAYHRCQRRRIWTSAWRRLQRISATSHQTVSGNGSRSESKWYPDT